MDVQKELQFHLRFIFAPLLDINTAKYVYNQVLGLACDKFAEIYCDTNATIYVMTAMQVLNYSVNRMSLNSLAP